MKNMLRNSLRKYVHSKKYRINEAKNGHGPVQS